MGLIERGTLAKNLSPPLDAFLVNQLLDEFISCERRFIQRDWGPAELDGGQFCEALARIIYHYDSGNLNRTRDLSDCLDYVENSTVAHKITPRHDAIHIARVIRTVYKLRSQRGAVHISPAYSPNQMDAKLVIECIRWCMNETLRIFWSGDREAVAKAIRELLQFDVPCIGVFENELIVQRTDLSTEEELLVLLHFAGEQGFTRRELGLHARRAPASITTSLQHLTSPSLRQVIELPGSRYRLTDLGAKRVREQLASKLLVQ